MYLYRFKLKYFIMNKIKELIENYRAKKLKKQEDERAVKNKETTNEFKVKYKDKNVLISNGLIGKVFDFYTYKANIIGEYTCSIYALDVMIKKKVYKIDLSNIIGIER